LKLEIKMNILKSLIFLFIFTVSYSQQDPEAKKILDDFSKKTKSYTAYSAKFTIESENRQNGEKLTNTGDILIKGDKYRMNLNKTVIFYNGNDVFNYIPESNEVSIAKPNKKKDDAFFKDPSKLFNIYTKDYKFRYLGETTINNLAFYEIDLYPFDINKKYSIIKLLIQKDNLQLLRAKVIMKSGVQYTLTILNFSNSEKASDKDFNFDIKAHKDIEVIDLRKK
jgi:outer membrane lipoprotein carrier protein